MSLFLAATRERIPHGEVTMASRKLNSAKRIHEKMLKRQRKLRRRQEERPISSSGVLVEPDGMEKMSDVLESFVEPYMEMATTDDGFRNLLTFGMAAWNAALLPADEQNAMIDRVVGKAHIFDADATFIRSFLHELIERKKAHYPTIRRFIINFSLTNTDDGFHLSVISSLSKASPPPNSKISGLPDLND
jgi:hypothetical protein